MMQREMLNARIDQVKATVEMARNMAIVFAIVWGSIIFVGQNAVRGIGNNNNNNHSMYVQRDTVHLDTSAPTHVIGRVPTDF